jgi:uncharacterized protein with HEPN domain
MERFREDKEKLVEMIKSIEKTQAAIGAMKFEDFVKGTGAREEIATHLRSIGSRAKQVSEDFKISHRIINWKLLHDLQFSAYNADDVHIDPYALWYIVENDLPIIKDQVFEISSVFEDKADDAFYI